MTPPKIFYLCYDHQRPNGGHKHTYQHVDVLNRCGFEAYAVHRRPKFRLTWFQNETRVIDYEQFQSMLVIDRDFVVVPEDMGHGILTVPGRKVVFNKNVFHGFTALGLDSPIVDPYLSADVVGAFAVSAHNAEQLRYAYPRLDVHEVVMDLRPEVFTFEPLAKKTPQVATIAKSPEAAAAIRMFRARAEAAPVRSRPCDLVLIRNYTEAEVAEILKRSLVFMWLSPAEGLGRMPLEALLSGCVVVSYAAGPLRTILPKELSGEYADPAQLVRLVEQVLEAWPENTAALQTLVSSGREQALKFGAREQERSVCDAWEAVLGKYGTKTAPLPTC